MHGAAAVALLVAQFVRHALGFSLFVPPFDTTQYTGGPLEALSDDGLTGAVVYWRVDDTHVHFGLAGTAWWVAFGMNPHGPSMAGADIFICREHQEGTVTAVDYHSTRYGAPELDELQDYETIAGGRELASFPAGPANGCDSGWTWGGNACFKVSATGADWASAERQCQSEGGDLAKIANEAQLTLVRSLARTGQSKIWLGAKWRGDAHKWQDGSALDFESFYDPSARTQECVCMGYNGNDDTGWFTSDCRWSEPRYACMKAVNAGVPTVPPQDQRSNPLITWCQVSRRRHTCEREQDIQLGDLTIGIHGLLAWSPYWQQGEGTPEYHGNDRRRSLPLTFQGMQPAPPPSDTTTFILEAPAHQVTLEGGSYACSYHKLPIPAGQRFHIIWYKVEQSGPAKQAGLQHHVDLNACTSPAPGIADGQAASCDYLMGSCWTTLLNQAGMYMPEGLDTPPNAGIPIGDGALQYVVISRHFYNPAQKAGVYDVGTKFHIRYTPSLRPNDMSQITLGSTQFIVPPKTFGHPVQSWCAGGCTQRLGNTQVTNVAFHMHGYARSTQVRVIRNGVELEPLAALNPWDQALANIAINRWLEPGDALIMECVYDNDLTRDIHYGDAIGDEMCFSFLTLVGQSSMSQCMEFPWGGFNCARPDSPECQGQEALSYCPDGQHSGAAAIVRHGAERAAPYQAYQEVTRPECAASGTFEVVPAIPGKCRTASSVIKGSKSCGLGSLTDFRVDWITDCAAQEVEFTVSAKIGATGGWLGLGLKDAGTATAPQPLGNAMTSTDIVQANIQGAMRDGRGVGFTAPQAKNSPVAQLLAVDLANGRSSVKFKRPFQSSEGVSLSQDGFVWLVCAYKSGNTDLDVKHSDATATNVRVSLFGGTAESRRYRLSDSANSPTTAPAPAPGGEGPCSGAQSPFVGSKDCGINGVDFFVQWRVDCSSQTAQFTLSATTSANSWLAVGFHDAGTAASPVAMGPAMQGADIVMVTPGGQIRDAVGSGYMSPPAKATAIASVVSSSNAAGRSTVTFQRPFASTEGLALQDTRRVWMICAYKDGTSDFAMMHQNRATVANAFSIFENGHTACGEHSHTFYGAKDCSAGSDIGFRVEWRTECKPKVVYFTLSANISSDGWMGIALHDAGFPNQRVPMTSAMMGSDIVQVNSRGDIRESIGIGYTMPRAKAATNATLDSVQRSDGRTVIRFRRSFEVQEGLSFVDGRSVWLSCAYRSDGGSLNARHEGAVRAGSQPISLFQGSHIHSLRLANVSYNSLCSNRVTSCETTWQDVIAHSLNVQRDQVVIVGMREGSLIVLFELTVEVPEIATSNIVSAIDQTIGSYRPSAGVQVVQEVVAAIRSKPLTEGPAPAAAANTPTGQQTANWGGGWGPRTTPSATPRYAGGQEDIFVNGSRHTCAALAGLWILVAAHAALAGALL